MPRDRNGSFDPKIVAKRQNRLTGSMRWSFRWPPKGLTTGESSAHLAEVYGAEVSRQTISTITDKVFAADNPHGPQYGRGVGYLGLAHRGSVTRCPW